MRDTLGQPGMGRRSNTGANPISCIAQLEKQSCQPSLAMCVSTLPTNSPLESKLPAAQSKLNNASRQRVVHPWSVPAMVNHRHVGLPKLGQIRSDLTWLLQAATASDVQADSSRRN
ncbi:hypothetical protein PoB_001683000 [Plakobranchus ocellatus]|uniref:Uncharacterized protein n=1 Tax=Plakobranchus ocellatus TaxID=259542 RepID=A0AAV3Z6Y9_9GAST|nr:hypothetical protein PoB_001683000 [Plakobranchus ocellatus]